jgi:hypothetical protein
MRVVPLALAAVIVHAPSLAGGSEAFLPPPEPHGTPPGAQPTSDARSPADGHRLSAALPRWGFALAAGFPDLATASVLYRPFSRVRLWAGPGWNSVAWGLQGGVALVPWNAWIAPVISAEAGRFFRSDLSFLAKDSGGVPEGMKPLLEQVDYTYGALALGADLGSPGRFAFTIRLGLSYVSIHANGTASFTSESGSGARFQLRDPSFRGTLPSLKLGVQYWF